MRASGAGSEGTTEPEGGDRWRVQVWPAPRAEPRVLRWWPRWDPAGVQPAPTTVGGRLLVGAGASDARVRMRWLASRSVAHLFEDAAGALWEHSNLPDAAGTPQLEELDGDEAERRYGNRSRWGDAGVPRPGLGTMARSLWQTWRCSRGWRPRPDPVEPVVEGGRRVIVGSTATSRLASMRRLGSEGGDSLCPDSDGALWEWRNAAGAAARPRLTEPSADEARAKYGTSG